MTKSKICFQSFYPYFFATFSAARLLGWLVLGLYGSDSQYGLRLKFRGLVPHNLKTGDFFFI